MITDFDSQESEEPTAQERLAQFREYSSPMACQLAGLLAACPEVNLPVVQMVQTALLPDSDQIHVAEVLLGGLFKSQAEITAHTPADRIQYVFHEGVKPLVQETISPQQSFKALSAWVKRRFGYALEDFSTYLTEAQNEEIKPFAEVMLEVLNRQSSRHPDLIDRFEELSRTETTIEIDPNKQDLYWPDFPEPEPLRLYVAQLVEAGTETWPPPLHVEVLRASPIAFDSPAQSTLKIEPFTFKVGTLVRSGDSWEVQKSDGRAYRYVERIDENVTLEMVAISGGKFIMGFPEKSEYEKPQHLVTVPDFYLGRYPVTQAQWRVVAAMPQEKLELDLDPSNLKGDIKPVEQVSWEDAIEFCARLSKHTKRQYRLPTEAEWEYACRAGTTTPFHFGETISPELANYNGTAYADGPTGKSRDETIPIDNFEIANAWGVCDMHGNVWEWCEDHWHDNYDHAPNDGNAWLTDDVSSPRILHGGSWNHNPWFCRSAYRTYDNPSSRCHVIGFRLACAAPEIFV